MFIVPFSQLPSIFPQAEAAQKPAQPQGGSVPFVDMLRESFANMQETRAASAQDGVSLAMGEVEDLHTMGINNFKAGAATTFASQLATRAISAYNEIIRMQV